MNELALKCEESLSEISVPEMLHIAASLVVRDEDSFGEISKIYKVAKRLEKDIEHQRKEANTPDQDRINERNDKARKLCEPLKKVQDLCKIRMTEYTLYLEQLKEQEKQKLLEAASMLDVEMPVPMATSKTVRGEGATVYTVYERRFDIEFLHMVPDQYWKVDTELLEKHIKMGYEQIPGVRIWTEAVQKVRAR